jgi:drug/metabolite transporter (DMT)-like permease
VNSKQLFQLVMLSAIWGGGFILLRVAAPTFGTWWLAELRGAVAALTMVGVVLGLFNLALPYACFSFGALHLPAAYLALINATSPLFTALWAAGWDGVPFTRRKLAGMALGLFGVALLVGLGPIAPTPTVLLAIGVVFLAPISYGFAGNYMKKFTAPVGPTRLVAGTQAAASLMLLPLAVVMGVPSAAPWPPTWQTWVAVLLIGALVTAYAFMLFYKLVAEAGPEHAMTVTYLMPVFAMAWGWLVLGERVTLVMLAGCAIILGGTALILRPGKAKG